MKYTDLIPFGEYRPDMPQYGAGLDVCLNVFSRGESYVPISNAAAATAALSSRPFGAASFKASDGASHTFAGTETKLFKLAGSSTWTDVTNSGGDYATANDGFWRFCQYGDRIIAVNGAAGDEVQTYLIGTSTDFEDLNASDAPKARTCAVINNFVFVGNTENSPNEVAWSGLDAPTSWSDNPTTMAGSQRIENEGGAVQAIVGFQNTGIIMQEKAIVRVQFVGPPLKFEFIDAVRGAGAVTTGSVVSHKSVVYFLDEDGFYAFDGTGVIPIGNKRVDKTFYSTLNQNYIDRITSIVDPINKLVIWSYPSVDSDGTPDKLIIYNFEDNKWSHADLEHEILFSALSAGVDLDSLDAIYGDLDSIPFSLDSRAFIGGSVALAIFDTDSKLGFLTGENLTSQFTSKFLQLNPKGRSFVDGVQVYCDADLTSVTATVESADSHAEFATASGPALVSPNNVSQFADLATDGRFQRVNIQIDDQNYTEASGFKLRYKESSDV